MLSIPGLRPDKVLKIYKELGISSVDELEKAAKADRLKPVKGLGVALQTKILQGIEIRRTGEGRRHLHRAAVLLQSAQDQLRKSKLEITRHRNVSDVHRPHLVGTDNLHSAQQIRIDLVPRLGFRRARTAIERLYPHPLHQRLHVTPADLAPLGRQQASQHSRAGEGQLQMQPVETPHRRRATPDAAGRDAA
jgi:hypothetical protein